MLCLAAKFAQDVKAHATFAGIEYALRAGKHLSQQVAKLNGLTADTSIVFRDFDGDWYAPRPHIVLIPRPKGAVIGAVS